MFKFAAGRKPGNERGRDDLVTRPIFARCKNVEGGKENSGELGREKGKFATISRLADLRRTNDEARRNEEARGKG